MMRSVPTFNPAAGATRTVSGGVMAAILAAQPGATRAEGDDKDKDKDDEAKRAAKAEQDKKDEDAKAKKAEDDEEARRKAEEDEKNKSAGYKEGEPNEQKDGKNAVADDRKRVQAILAIGERTGKPKKAAKIAFTTDMTAEQAEIMLVDDDEPQAGSNLRDRMASVDVPNVGPSGASRAAPNSAAATAALIVAAGKKARGETV